LAYFEKDESQATKRHAVGVKGMRREETPEAILDKDWARLYFRHTKRNDMSLGSAPPEISSLLIHLVLEIANQKGGGAQSKTHCFAV